jgi:lipopolysaccharide transport system permease protein
MTAAVLAKGAHRIVTYPALLYRSWGQVWTLVKRELRGRYLSSIFGGLWMVINPLILLIVYYFVFAKILSIKFGRLGFTDDEGTAAGFFLFCGMIPWMAFAECLQRSTNIIIENSNLIKKVAFPSEILPVYIVVYTFINELVGISILLAAKLLSGGSLSSVMLFFPVLALVRIVLTLGFSYFFAAFNVFVRDFLQIVGLLLTLWMFVTPIFYTLAIVPEQYRYLYRYNPMMYVVEGYRDVFLNEKMPDFGMFFAYLAMGVGIFIVGYGFFAATKHKFADEV